MNYFKTYRRRCDEPMRRSKERGFTASGKRWRCKGECKNCICCLETRYDGTEEHFNPMFTGRREDEQ